MDVPSVEFPFQSLIGKKAWGLTRTYGSMFFLEFGVPTLRPDTKKTHGEWHILVEHCFWRFESNGDVVVSADSEASDIDNIFSDLNLEQVTGGAIENRHGGSSILFSTGVVLKIFPQNQSAENDEDQWTLYGLGRNYYAMAADGSLRKSSE